jgi:hypothetical protein
MWVCCGFCSIQPLCTLAQMRVDHLSQDRLTPIVPAVIWSPRWALHPPHVLIIFIITHPSLLESRETAGHTTMEHSSLHSLDAIIFHSLLASSSPPPWKLLAKMIQLYCISRLHINCRTFPHYLFGAYLVSSAFPSNIDPSTHTLGPRPCFPYRAI